MPQVLNEATDEVDREHIGDCQEVSEYIPEICHYMFETEEKDLPSPNYMNRQNDVNEKMRGILVDWIIEVHLKFKLLPETLFLTVGLIDRYLEKTQIMRTKLQLVAVSAMLIASKYEEIYAPEVRDFVFITDNAYTREEILTMEMSILTTLQFNITSPSAFRFLERFRQVAKLDDQQWNLARYLIELPLIEQRMLVYKPSLLAASAIFLANRIINQGTWTDQMR